MSIPDFQYTQPEYQNVDESTLSQAQLSLTKPYSGDAMDLDTDFDWKNQIHLHETEKNMVVAKTLDLLYVLQILARWQRPSLSVFMTGILFYSQEKIMSPSYKTFCCL